MVRNKELSTEKRAQVQALSGAGQSHRQIARTLKISVSCVSRTLQRIAATGNYKSKARSGRPKVTSDHTNRAIHRYAMAKPFASASEIRASLHGILPLPSVATIKRILLKFNLRSYKPAKRPFLSPKNIRERISFCTRYRQWTSDDWAKVMFTDETAVYQFRTNRPHVRRPPNQRFNHKYLSPTVRSNPSVMIWGAISSAGRCGLHFLPKGETVKAANYLRIIQEKVPLFLNIRRVSIFQQDNAPAHKAKTITRWLAEQQQQFTVLEGWPGNSPDLSPIENCWNYMKDIVNEHHCGSLDELIQTVKRVWTMNITPAYCKKLIDSMPKRLALCLANNGGAIKY